MKLLGFLYNIHNKETIKHSLKLEEALLHSNDIKIMLQTLVNHNTPEAASSSKTWGTVTNQYCISIKTNQRGTNLPAQSDTDTLTVTPPSDTYTIRNKPFWKICLYGITARKNWITGNKDTTEGKTVPIFRKC